MNVHNGSRSKTMLSDATGEVADVNEIVLTLYARGLTTGGSTHSRRL
jgi:hypothetical protein